LAKIALADLEMNLFGLAEIVKNKYITAAEHTAIRVPAETQ